jgi:hypothetical protein
LSSIYKKVDTEAKVGEEVGTGVGVSVGDKVGVSVGDNVGGSVGTSVGDKVGVSVGDKVCASETVPGSKVSLNMSGTPSVEGP